MDDEFGLEGPTKPEASGEPQHELEAAFRMEAEGGN